MLSVETEKTLRLLATNLGSAVALLPWAGCSTAGKIIEKYGPDLIVESAKRIGISEVVLVVGAESAEMTGEIDMRSGK